MKEVFKSLLRDKAGLFGLFGVILILIIAVFAPFISPHDPNEINAAMRLSPPSSQHPFGTDFMGRDIMSRVFYGAQVSFIVGLISVSIGASIGFILGIVAGYSKTLDGLIMRTVDILFAFPAILLALLIVSVLGPDLGNTMIAIGVVLIPVFTRTQRASVIAVKEMDYVSNANSVGIRTSGVILRHIIPNTLSPIWVQITLSLSNAILTESTLSFLGLGIQPPDPSWGSMLNEARPFMELAPWTVIFPAISIVITILSFNMLGDSLRDVLDPKLKL